MKTAGNNRQGRRDATMILMAFRHGLEPKAADGSQRVYAHEI